MKTIQKFEVVIDSMLLNLSMQPDVPINNGKHLPMELLVIIEDPEGIIDPIVMTLGKEAVIGVLNELKRLTPVVEYFG